MQFQIDFELWFLDGSRVCLVIVYETFLRKNEEL